MECSANRDLCNAMAVPPAPRHASGLCCALTGRAAHDDGRVVRIGIASSKHRLTAVEAAEWSHSSRLSRWLGCGLHAGALMRLADSRHAAMLRGHSACKLREEIHGQGRFKDPARQDVPEQLRQYAATRKQDDGWEQGCGCCGEKARIGSEKGPCSSQKDCSEKALIAHHCLSHAPSDSMRSLVRACAEFCVNGVGFTAEGCAPRTGW